MSGMKINHGNIGRIARLRGADLAGDDYGVYDGI
jgi:hypothetical protein